MFPISSDRQDVYLYADPVDMRKSIDGLSAIVEYQLEQNPVCEKLFVFCNRKQDKIKILQWSGNGFWVHYKRLEVDTFQWFQPDGDHICISRQQLNWLLDGLPIEQNHAHQTLTHIYGIT